MTCRPADEDRAGGRNTLTRFADLDLATEVSNAEEEQSQLCECPTSYDFWSGCAVHGWEQS